MIFYDTWYHSVVVMIIWLHEATAIWRLEDVISGISTLYFQMNPKFFIFQSVVDFCTLCACCGVSMWSHCLLFPCKPALHFAVAVSCAARLQGHRTASTSVLDVCSLMGSNWAIVCNRCDRSFLAVSCLAQRDTSLTGNICRGTEEL